MTAAELLAKPENWCQKAFAMDGDGKTVPLESATACRFCLTGSLFKVYTDGFGPAWDKVVATLGSVYGTSDAQNLAHWNDNPKRTHAEVLALLKKAGV